MRWGPLGIVALTMGVAAPSRAQDFDAEEDEDEPTSIPEISGEISEVPIEQLLKMPVVESASRRKQSLHEAPASLSVIRGDQALETSPLSIADSLRRVPGVHVMQVNANLMNVGMRGVNRVGNKNVTVLFNGRRFSEVSVGSPPWIGFPAHVAEIDRIEVLRGPGTTLYGADAMNGVISIRTERPLDHPGTEAVFATGTALLPNQPADFERQRLQNVSNGYASHTFTSGDRSFGTRLGVGFAHQPEWSGGSDYSRPRYGDFGYHAALSLDWRPDPSSNVFLDARHVMAEGINAADTLTSQPLYLAQSEQSVTVSFEKPLLPELVAKGSGDFRRLQSTTIVMIEGPLGRAQFQPQNLTSHALLQLDFTAFGGRNVLSVAGEVSDQLTYNWFDQRLEQLSLATLIQDEVRLLDDPRLILSAAVRLERVTSEGGAVEDTLIYNNLNPRLSLVARVAPRHSVRLTAATAYRTPSPFESLLTLTNADVYGPGIPPLPTLVPNPSLEPERVQSLELGYRGRLADWLLTDSVLFLQRYENPIQLNRPALPLQYENNPDQDHHGVELGFTLKGGDHLLGYLSYTLTRSVDADSGESTEQFPTHLLAAGGSGRWDLYRAGLDFNFISATTPTLLLPEQDGLVPQRHEVAAQPILSLRAGRSLLHGDAELFVHAINVLAVFRERGELMQFPNANVDPIGATFLVGVRL